MTIAARVMLTLAGLVAAVLLADGLAHDIVAQAPFGASRAGAADPQGVIGWLLDMQSQFYRQMSTTIRAAKNDGRAVWTLLVISFAYGAFHAAGPGHGKAVISSYLIANEETARRGIVLAFASALIQALVAIAIVGVGAWLLNATAQGLCGAERVIEVASYTLVAAVGARLLWIKGREFTRALKSRPILRDAAAMSPTLVPAMAPNLEVVREVIHHHAKSHDHSQHHGASTPVGSGHVHDEHCGHHHGPAPDQLAGPGGWRRGLGAILAVGLRPCSGAILVLVFALAQGMFWAGVTAALLMGLGTAMTVSSIAVLAVSAKGLARRLSAKRSAGAVLILRGLEFGAAGLIVLFGSGLLLGLVAAERVTCF